MAAEAEAPPGFDRAFLALVHREGSRPGAAAGCPSECPVSSYGVVVDCALKVERIVAAVGLNIHLQRTRGHAGERAAQRKTASRSRATGKAGARGREIQICNIQVSTAGLAHAQAKVENRVAVIRTHQCCCPVPVNRAVMGVRTASCQQEGDSDNKNRSNVLHRISTSQKDEVLSLDATTQQPGTSGHSRGQRGIRFTVKP